LRASLAEFRDADRAQVQVPRERGEQQPELSDDRVSPNLYQQSLDDQLRRQRQAQERGTFEGETRPFRNDDDVATRDPTREANRRREAAERSAVDDDANALDADGDLAGGLLDRRLGAGVAGGLLAGAFARQDAAADLAVREDDADLDPEQTQDPITDTRVDQDPRDMLDTGQDVDQRLDQDTPLDLDRDIDQRTDQDTRDFDFGQDLGDPVDRDQNERDPEFPDRDPDLDLPPEFENPEEDSTLPRWVSDSNIFDTGVVQSLDELNDDDTSGDVFAAYDRLF
jgi:hypothetical protein